MVQPSTLLCLIEEWLSGHVDDDVIADGLEEAGYEDLAKRFKRKKVGTEARKRETRSRLVRDVIYLMPRLRVKQFMRGRKTPL